HRELHSFPTRRSSDLNLMNTLKKNSVYLAVLALGFGFSSCSDDDDNGTVVIPDTTASVTANAQVVSQNEILVSSVNLEADSWLVDRKSTRLNSSHVKI